MSGEHGPSSLGVALRSTFLPGWGQLAIDRTGLGKALIMFTGLLAIAALTLFLFVDPVEVAVWLSDPDVLLAAVAVNIAIAAVRLFATGHAWWAAGGQGRSAAVLLAIFVALPHVAVAWVGLEARGSLLHVFASDSMPSGTAATSTTTTTTTTTTPPIDLVAVTGPPGQYGDDVLGATRTKGWRPFGQERLNILLLGGDAGPGRGGLRTDTMIVASIDPVSGDAALVGVPRNFGGITLSDGTPVPVAQLGHVYSWGRSHPDHFGGVDPGASAVLDAVGYITGLDIDNFVLVDLTGFADLIDVLGGVSLDVPSTVHAPLYDPRTGGYEMIDIRPGSQRMDGGTALAYARARYGSSDYTRMARQRCILASLATQTDPLKLLTRLGEILDVVDQTVTTDLPLDEVPDLVRLLFQVDLGRITVVGFDSTWSAGSTSTGHPIPNIDRIRDAVRRIVEGEASDVRNVAMADEACA